MCALRRICPRNIELTRHIVSEADLDREVRRLLAGMPWLEATSWSAHDNRLSHGSGVPDWCFIGTRILWRELKLERGRLSDAQKRWRWSLFMAGADWAIWRPADLYSGRIERELRAIDYDPASI